MLIWHLFYKAQILIFGTYFTKPKSILATILQSLLYAQSPNANLALILQSLSILLATIS